MTPQESSVSDATIWSVTVESSIMILDTLFTLNYDFTVRMSLMTIANWSSTDSNNIFIILATAGSIEMKGITRCKLTKYLNQLFVINSLDRSFPTRPVYRFLIDLWVVWVGSISLQEIPMVASPRLYLGISFQIYGWQRVSADPS